MSARIIRVTGLVQGVFFRAETKTQANNLGIKGWVRNDGDGSVRIHAEGNDEDLETLIQWCRSGPPAANVSDVRWESSHDQQYSGFDVLP